MWSAAWCAVALSCLLCCASAHATPLGSIAEYPLTYPDTPFDITAGPDGNMWFTNQWRGMIGEIDPSTRQIAQYPIAGGVDVNSHPLPFGIVAGPDGNLWFTDEGEVRSVGEMNPTTHQVTEYPISTSGGNAYPNPDAIAVGPDGNLWFTETGTIPSIGELDAQTHAITQYAIPSGAVPAASVPGEIAAGPDGNLWFTVGSSIGEISPSTHQITEYPIPYRASDIASGPDGDLWFIGGNVIGEINPTTHQISNYPLPGWPGVPSDTVVGEGIAAGPDGNVWFTVAWNWFPASGGNPQAVGEISPITHAIVEFPIPIGPSLYRSDPEEEPSGIAAGPDGNVWFTDQVSAVSEGVPSIDVVSPAEAVVSNVNVSGDGTAHLRLTAAVQGRIDVLETAWDDNLVSGLARKAAAAAIRPEPASGRFVFARASSPVASGGTASFTIAPNAVGHELVRRHSYRVTLRLWVEYTPVGGRPQTIGYYGLHLGSGCPDVASIGGRLKAKCAWVIPRWSQ
jgi:streptogramin lyase